ncbi:large subunit ribosomal protein L4 [Anaeroplasma bactoclasticum]|jgi:large subunit ribosomal protein L4|uniref:Large ribosomal subunit protein uL4 n=1 Tax=Anaeroplasma bactoclasticum TaxID=2088 RepID=A0A397RUZ3_9MOLU|nr:50S ribosomal protein L4 [Anaeroplasma bactoclasticum]RIA78160.1 large subunit ribosomal protein L4 [Anaeroplasma bactoclasticum]
MPTIAVLNQSGEKVKDLELSEAVFGVEINKQVVYDVVNAQRAAMRQGTHDTKGRSEVRGGGKKPWRQKGTGRARQGSTRAPQWVGGGTVFGPTPRSYAFKLNKKVKQLGMKNTLTYFVNENKLIAVENVTLADAKTKNFVKLLANIKADGKTVVVVAPEEFNETQVLASRNINGVYLTPANNASVYELLCYKNLVLTEAAVKYFEEVLK